MGPRAAAARRSPVRAGLTDLIGLKPAGESVKLPVSRVRVLASGGHLSAFKGRGVEYDESRPYQDGDDLRTFDWRVTARTGKPHTKIFREERNRPVLIWLDLRGPMHFATRGAYKAVLAAETAALIAWAATANGDRLGGLVFSESCHHELRPQLGRRAALGLLRAVVDERFWDSAQAGTSAGAAAAEHALERLARVTRPGSLVFLLSDFRELGAGAERALWQLRSHADLFLMHYFDPVEAELPPPDRYRIQVGERSVAIDTGSTEARARYQRRFAARRERLQAASRLPGIHMIDCPTTEDPHAVLAKRFRR